MKRKSGRLILAGLWTACLLMAIAVPEVIFRFDEFIPILFVPVLAVGVFMLPMMAGMTCGLRHLGFGNRFSRLLVTTALLLLVVVSGKWIGMIFELWQFTGKPGGNLNESTSTGFALGLFITSALAGTFLASLTIGKIFRQRWILCRDEATPRKSSGMISLFIWLAAIAVMLACGKWLLTVEIDQAWYERIGIWVIWIGIWVIEFAIVFLVHLLVLIPFLACLVATRHPWTWCLFWAFLPGVFLVGASWIVIQAGVVDGPSSWLSQIIENIVVPFGTFGSCLIAFLAIYAAGLRTSGYLHEMGERKISVSGFRNRVYRASLLFARCCIVGVTAYLAIWITLHVRMAVIQPDDASRQRNFLSGFLGKPITEETLGQASKLLYDDPDFGKPILANFTGLRPAKLIDPSGFPRLPNEKELREIAGNCTPQFQAGSDPAINRIGNCLPGLSAEVRIDLMLSMPWEDSWFPEMANRLKELEPEMVELGKRIPEIVNSPEVATGVLYHEPTSRLQGVCIPLCSLCAMNDLGEGRPEQALHWLKMLDEIATTGFCEAPRQSNHKLLQAILSIAPHLVDCPELEAADRDYVAGVIDRIAEGDLAKSEFKACFAMYCCQHSSWKFDFPEPSWYGISITSGNQNLLAMHLGLLPGVVDWHEAGRLSRIRFNEVVEALDRAETGSQLLKQLNRMSSQSPNWPEIEESIPFQISAAAGFPSAKATCVLSETEIARMTLTRHARFALSIIAKARLVIVARALKAWRAEHGSWPANLQQLVGSQLDVLPLDPNTDKDFVYKTIGDGFDLYSPGANQVYDFTLNNSDDIVFDDATILSESMIRALELSTPYSSSLWDSPRW